MVADTASASYRTAALFPVDWPLAVSFSLPCLGRCPALTRLDLADIVGIYNVTLVASVVMTLMFFVWLACDQLFSCIILVVIMGMFGGAFVSLQAPLATKTATDMRFGGTMVGQALCGSLESRHSGTKKSLTLCSCPIILAARLWSDLRCCPWPRQRGRPSCPLPVCHHPWRYHDGHCDCSAFCSPIQSCGLGHTCQNIVRQHVIVRTLACMYALSLLQPPKSQIERQSHAVRGALSRQFDDP